MGFNGEHEYNAAALHAQRIEHTAQTLRVPTILRSEPSVQEYLHAHTLFSDMQQTLADAATRLAVRDPDEPYTPPALWRGPDGTPQRYVPKPPRLIAPSMQETLRTNYQDAGRLLDVATALTEEGVLARPPSHVFLQEKFNPVLDRFGLALADGRAPDDRGGTGWQKGRSRFTRLIDHDIAYAQLQHERQHHLEETADDVRLMVITRDSATRQYKPHGRWIYAPQLHDYAQVLNTMHQLHATIATAGERGVREAGSRISDEQEAWVRIRDVVRTANEMVWEGINGHAARPYRLAVDLSDVLEPYALHVDSKQPEGNR